MDRKQLAFLLFGQEGELLNTVSGCEKLADLILTEIEREEKERIKKQQEKFVAFVDDLVKETQDKFRMMDFG